MNTAAPRSTAAPVKSLAGHGRSPTTTCWRAFWRAPSGPSHTSPGTSERPCLISSAEAKAGRLRSPSPVQTKSTCPVDRNACGLADGRCPPTHMRTSSSAALAARARETDSCRPSWHTEMPRRAGILLSSERRTSDWRMSTRSASRSETSCPSCLSAAARDSKPRCSPVQRSLGRCTRRGLRRATRIAATREQRVVAGLSSAGTPLWPTCRTTKQCSPRPTAADRTGSFPPWLLLDRAQGSCTFL